jgi:mono/diheme cytochrome c family protein
MRTIANKVRSRVITGRISLKAWLGLVAALAMFLPKSAAAQGGPLPLVWDSLVKDAWPQPGQPTAEFEFEATNVSDAVVTVESVTTSCGCTLAKIPSQPWPFAPHTNGEMTVSVNLAGKSGTVTKYVTVNTEKLGSQVLTVTIHMPDSPEATRQRNLQMATVDRQAVFKGDCARCHSDPGEGKLGADLFQSVCGVCHEAKTRATMVADLKNLNHATDYDFWKMTITIGKPGTLMPAFATVAGGPLTDEQIDSLARFLVTKFPSHATNSTATSVLLPAAAVTPAGAKN